MMQRACADLHVCRKCGDRTAECWRNPDDDYGDIKYLCTKAGCGWSWWVEGSDS